MSVLNTAACPKCQISSRISAINTDANVRCTNYPTLCGKSDHLATIFLNGLVCRELTCIWTLASVSFPAQRGKNMVHPEPDSAPSCPKTLLRVGKSTGTSSRSTNLKQAVSLRLSCYLAATETRCKSYCFGATPSSFCVYAALVRFQVFFWATSKKDVLKKTTSVLQWPKRKPLNFMGFPFGQNVVLGFKGVI